MSDLNSKLFCNKNYDFELDKIIAIIQQNNYTSVGIQLPEGVKNYALSIINYIQEKTSLKVVVSANPCFGSCDLDFNILCFVDVLFHFGHSEIASSIPNHLKNKIYFIELKSNLSIISLINAICVDVFEDKIGLLSTIQHVHKLNELKSKLSDITNKEFFICSGDKRVKYPGQILGCNFSSARMCLKFNCRQFLYLGSGMFHPIGISIATNKSVICMDPYTLSINVVDNKKYYLKRNAIISNLIYNKSKIYGIIISSKSGQQRIKLANYIYKRIIDIGYKGYFIVLDNVLPDQLRSFDVDAFINTACPRLSIDDSSLFHVPLITPQEFEIIIGDNKWEELTMDEIIEL